DSSFKDDSNNNDQIPKKKLVNIYTKPTKSNKTPKKKETPVMTYHETTEIDDTNQRNDSNFEDDSNNNDLLPKKKELVINNTKINNEFIKAKLPKLTNIQAPVTAASQAMTTQITTLQAMNLQIMTPQATTPKTLTPIGIPEMLGYLNRN
ncbi:21087_t:CDS:2, partial [Gigaspora rosea]